MKIRFRMIAFAVVILFAALACNLLPTNDSVDPSQSELETAVAQTLAAGDTAGDDDGGGGVADPTDTPAPPETPASSVPHVVYVDGGDLWLWTEAGGAVELYSGETVEKVIISPDAEVIAFTTVDSDFTVLGMWRIYSDGTGLQRLVSGADFVSLTTDEDALGAAPYLWQFIPGTHTLAFNTRLIFEGPGLAIQDDIRHLDLDSGSLSTFLSPGTGGNFYYSPDGSQIALTTPESVSLINADGTNRMDDVITFPFVRTASEYAFYPVPVWKPESNAFLVIIPPEDPFADGAFSPAYGYVVTSSGTATKFGPFLGELSHFEAGEKIAPDGSAIAYYDSTGSGLELFIADLDGPDTPIDTNVTSFKGWAPDASKFIYQTTTGELWAGQVGAAPVLLDSSGGPGDLIFLEDGRFVYASGTFGTFSIRLGTLEGGSILIASPSADFPVFDVAQ